MLSKGHGIFPGVLSSISLNTLLNRACGESNLSVLFNNVLFSNFYFTVGKTVVMAYLSDKEHVWCWKVKISCLYCIYWWHSYNLEWARGEKIHEFTYFSFPLKMKFKAQICPAILTPSIFMPSTSRFLQNPALLSKQLLWSENISFQQIVFHTLNSLQFRHSELC